MALRCNESNLLFDSQSILPAITLILSGQWILMTMKVVSCEDTFSTSCVSDAGMVLLFHSPPREEQHLCPFVVVSRGKLCGLYARWLLHCEVFWTVLLFDSILLLEAFWNNSALQSVVSPDIPLWATRQCRSHCTLSEWLWKNLTVSQKQQFQHEIIVALSQWGTWR